MKSESVNIKYVPVEHERKKVWSRASFASQDGSQCGLVLPGPFPQYCTGLWAKTTGQFKTLNMAQNYFLQVDGGGSMAPFGLKPSSSLSISGNVGTVLSLTE